LCFIRGLAAMDEIIFKKAQKGDMEAFEALIKAYEKLIYNASYSMLANPQDAEDISQEVIIKVYNNLHGCKSPAAFKSWLFRIVNNTCIDEIRKRKGKTTLSLDYEPEDSNGRMENPALMDETTPESEFLRKDMNEKIQLAISQIPPDYRAVIVMRDINGMSYDEIMNTLVISMGTVKSRIARARKHLRDKLVEMEVYSNREQNL